MHKYIPVLKCDSEMRYFKSKYGIRRKKLRMTGLAVAKKRRLQLPGCSGTDGVQCACAEQTVARMI